MRAACAYAGGEERLAVTKSFIPNLRPSGLEGRAANLTWLGGTSAKNDEIHIESVPGAPFVRLHFTSGARLRANVSCALLVVDAAVVPAGEFSAMIEDVFVMDFRAGAVSLSVPRPSRIGLDRSFAARDLYDEEVVIVPARGHVVFGRRANTLTDAAVAAVRAQGYEFAMLEDLITAELPVRNETYDYTPWRLVLGERPLPEGWRLAVAGPPPTGPVVNDDTGRVVSGGFTAKDHYRGVEPSTPVPVVDLGLGMEMVVALDAGGGKLTKKQRSAVERCAMAWVEEGTENGFGDGSFHGWSGGEWTSDGYRFDVDTGSQDVDWDAAFAELGRRFGACRDAVNLPTARIVAGLE